MTQFIFKIFTPAFIPTTFGNTVLNEDVSNSPTTSITLENTGVGLGTYGFVHYMTATKPGLTLDLLDVIADPIAFNMGFRLTVSGGTINRMWVTAPGIEVVTPTFIYRTETFTNTAGLQFDSMPEYLLFVSTNITYYITVFWS